MQPTNPNVRYAFLDGIRGLTALYVVLNHLWARFLGSASELPPWFHLLKFGHAAVGIFIVLSGFCLMLPVTRTETLSLRGGSARFLQRRAWRILPPYYAALALSFLLAATLPQLRPPGELTWANALAHVFLVHNWIPALSITLNGPLWSIALEWQIYFVFALVLLPLRRRFGPLAALGAALLMGVVPIFLGCGPGNPWFIVLFAGGMLGAELSTRAPAQLTQAQSYRFLLLSLFTLAVHLVVWRDRFPWPKDPLGDYTAKIALDLLLAAMVVSWLVVGSRTALPPLLRPLFRVLESRPLVALGGFSYSLYLMHDPILLYSVQQLTPFIQAAPLAMFRVVIAAIVPLVLGLCYLFYQVFERPFLRRL